MVPFSPVTTQNRVCLSGQRHDWVPATPHPLFHQSRCNPNGVLSPPKNESPIENEPPIH